MILEKPKSKRKTNSGLQTYISTENIHGTKLFYTLVMQKNVEAVLQMTLTTAEPQIRRKQS